MSHFIIHNIVVHEDDELYSDYLLSLSHRVEVQGAIDHSGTKTYSCFLDEGQYQLFVSWLDFPGNKKLKEKFMKEIKV